jgi:hypothetical protein
MIRIRNTVYGFKNPDPYQNVTDPEHCIKGLTRTYVLMTRKLSETNIGYRERLEHQYCFVLLLRVVAFLRTLSAQAMMK